MGSHSEKIERVELGCPGHLIVAYYCRWRRHTKVGRYRVSTVGNYIEPLGDGTRKEVGLGRFFETMVFRLTGQPRKDDEGCGCGEVEDWGDIDFAGYQTAGDAQAGHERMVAKYLALAKKEAKK